MILVLVAPVFVRLFFFLTLGSTTFLWVLKTWIDLKAMLRSLKIIKLCLDY
jgi:hypothetical protein